MAEAARRPAGPAAARPDAPVRLAGAVARASGWRGAALTVGLGAATALALPPVHLLLGLFAFAALAWRLDGRSRAAEAAWTGWLFAFGHHLAGLYWIPNAMLVDGGRFAWAMPSAVLGLPALLALFPAAALALAPALSRPGPGRAVAAILLWSLSDYARGHMFTGFPWNLPAYALSAFDAPSQAAAWLGAPGLSLAVLAVAAAPALIVGPEGWRGRGAAMAATLVLLCVPAALWAGGAARLLAHPPAHDGTAVVRVVQGNIPQRLKWRRDLRDAHLARYLALSQTEEPAARGPGVAAGTRPTAVVWPETAVPTFLNRKWGLRRAIATAVPAGGGLVAGAPSAVDDEENRDILLFNSMLVLDGEGNPTARYDKARLVPFGEFLPFREWIPIPAIVANFLDFDAGPGRRTIAVPGLGPVSPLICYEAIFPGEVVDRDGPPPAALLNLTNDAWYGRSAGPFQHSAIARMRAIEEGLPLIRAANTGISGVYDALGRGVVELGLERTGAIDARLPRALDPPPLYARWGDAIYLAALAAGLLPLLLAAARRRAGGRPESA